MTHELLDADPPEDAPEIRNDDVDMESQMTPPGDTGDPAAAADGGPIQAPPAT